MKEKWIGLLVFFASFSKICHANSKFEFPCRETFESAKTQLIYHPGVFGQRLGMLKSIDQLTRLFEDSQLSMDEAISRYREQHQNEKYVSIKESYRLYLDSLGRSLREHVLKYPEGNSYYSFKEYFEREFVPYRVETLLPIERFFFSNVRNQVCQGLSRANCYELLRLRLEPIRRDPEICRIRQYDRPSARYFRELKRIKRYQDIQRELNESLAGI